MLDAEAGLGPADRALISDARWPRSGRPTIVVLNKLDRVAPPDAPPDHGRARASSSPGATSSRPARRPATTSTRVLARGRRRAARGTAPLPRGRATRPRPSASSSQEMVREQLFLPDRRRRFRTAPRSSSTRSASSRSANLVVIQATILVDRETHKGIVIGTGGQRLQEIGTRARLELEALFGVQVFLELFVRVEPRLGREPAAARRSSGCDGRATSTCATRAARSSPSSDGRTSASRRSSTASCAPAGRSSTTPRASRATASSRARRARRAGVPARRHRRLRRRRAARPGHDRGAACASQTLARDRRRPTASSACSTGTRASSPEDRETVRLLRRSGKPVLWAVNKIDNAGREALAARLPSAGRRASSSRCPRRTAAGSSDLLDAIVARAPRARRRAPEAARGHASRAHRPAERRQVVAPEPAPRRGARRSSRPSRARRATPSTRRSWSTAGRTC